MELFYESSLPATIAGTVLLFFVLAFWYVSRKTWLLSLTVVPLLVIAGGIALDVFIETDFEAVQKTFDSVRCALLENDVETVEQYLTPEAKKTFDRAKWALDSFDIRKIGIYDLKLEFNDYTTPPTVTASFQGVVKYTGKNAQNSLGETYLANFTVELEKSDENVWLITHHVENYN